MTWRPASLMIAASRPVSFVVIDGDVVAAVAWQACSLGPAVSTTLIAVAPPVAVSPRQ